MSAEEDLEEVKRERCPNIWRAADRGLLGAVRHFLRQDPACVNQRPGNDSRTALRWAAFRGHLPVVELLLSSGADLHARDNDDEYRTALHWAAEYGHLSVVELLLRSGAELEAKTKHGKTALLMAAYKGSRSVVELLLRSGAELEARDNNGMTPLHWAARWGSTEAAELLVGQGADIDAKDKEGRTPLRLVLQNSSSDARVRVLEVLLGAGAALESWAEGLWRLAAERDSLEVAQQLLDRGGADFRAKDSQGMSLLHVAALHNSLRVAELLLRSGATLEAKDDYGATPLEIAEQKGHEKMVALFREGTHAVHDPGLREKLQGLYTKWQRYGFSLLPLVRLFFVGRGRAGKTTTLRCLKGEEPQKDERSTHGVELSASEFQEVRQDLGAGGAERPWTKFKDSVFEHCAVKGVKEELTKSSEEEVHLVDEGLQKSQSEADLSQKPSPLAHRMEESAPHSQSATHLSPSSQPLETAAADVKEPTPRETKTQESLGPARMHADLEAAVDTEGHSLKVRLQCWDCPGQQEYALLNLLYFQQGIYVVVCDMSEALEEEWHHLSFWLWAISQHARTDNKGREAKPPILLVGTKMGKQKIREQELDEKIEDLMRRVPALKKQLQLGPRRRQEGACSKWLFPMENIPEKDKEMWHLCAQDVRERIEEIAKQMVDPKYYWQKQAEDEVPDFVGSHAELYPVPWLRAYDLLAELGDGFQATLPNLDLVKGLKGQDTRKLPEDVMVTHSKSGVTLRAPAGTVLRKVESKNPREVKLQCNFLSLEAVRGLLAGIQPRGVHGPEVEEVLSTLNRLGVLVWFSHPHLKELVILNPHVVATAMANLMTICYGDECFEHGDDCNKRLQDKKKSMSKDEVRELLRFRTAGVVTVRLLEKLWNDFSSAEQRLMQEVLLQRQLLVNRAMKDEFLLACCLPLAYTPETKPKPEDFVTYTEMGGILSPNLFPLLAQKISAQPSGKSMVMKSGPPQIFRNRLEASVKGGQVHLSLFPLESHAGQWRVRIHVESLLGALQKPEQIARSIRKHVLDIMGFAEADSDGEELEPDATHHKSSHERLAWLLQERQRGDMSEQLQEVVNQVALQPSVRPAGSYRFKRVRFPGDVDLYEYLVLEAKDADEAIEKLAESLQQRAKQLGDTEDFFVSELKAGETSFQREEVEMGQKREDSKLLTDALRDRHTFGRTAKLDVFVKVPLFQDGQPRFVEVTNVMGLGYVPGVGQSIVPVTQENDHLAAVENGLKEYCGPHPKAMKYLKRLWERSSFLAQRGFDLEWHVKILEAIHPIFQHWVAKIGAIADHIEALRKMLRRKNEMMQKAALEDIGTLRSSLESFKEELLIAQEDRDGSTMESLAAREGLRAMEEAQIYLNRFPKVRIKDLEKIWEALGGAQKMLNAGLETVLIHRLSLLPQLAAPQDWVVPSSHLPVGGRISLGDESICVASWVHSNSLYWGDIAREAVREHQRFIEEVAKMLPRMDLLCIRCWKGSLEKLERILEAKGSFKMQSFGEEEHREVIIFKAEKLQFIQEKSTYHVGEASYKRANPKRAVVSAHFALKGRCFQVLFTQVPAEAYGPARRELARCVAQLADEDTLLMGDLSFPEEALGPHLLHCGLETLNFLQIPYPTTICQGSCLPKRTDSIAVIPASSEVKGEALEAEEVMEGLQQVADQLNSRSAKPPTHARFMSDKKE